MKITTLQTVPKSEYQDNLDEVLRLYKEAESSDFVLAPEVCLTDFDYDSFKKAAKFGKVADKVLKKEVTNTPLALTMIEKKGKKFFNTLKVYHKGKIIHSQSKNKLFLLGDEDKYFTAGKRKAVKKFTLGGVKYGVLICFELRFTDFWRELEGVDVVLIPAAWGKPRKDHFEKLATALAIANRCFVVLSDLKGEKYAGSSSVVTPFGMMKKDDRKSALTFDIDLAEIKKMKRYIPYK